jgi:Protein of unknown function (DUF2795)
MMGKQIPDTSETESDTKPKTRNRKGFREPTSLHVDPKLWQEVRVMAVLKGVSLAEYFEDALRRKIDADNKEAGKEGYRVGQGGMYIPPPPQPKIVAKEIKEELPQGYIPPEKALIFDLNLPGIEFPATKKEIIECAKKATNTRSVLNALNKIPDRKYHDEEGDLRKRFVQALKEEFSSQKGKANEQQQQVKE